VIGIYYSGKLCPSDNFIIYLFIEKNIIDVVLRWCFNDNHVLTFEMGLSKNILKGTIIIVYEKLG
jgi:hypothetical protein|tara:strand:- start:164 stop:358 length:195 start_codon:yes stop_codon:yes gene_type:complete